LKGGQDEILPTRSAIGRLDSGQWFQKPRKREASFQKV